MTTTENSRADALTTRALRAALAELVERCDGQAGVRADGSNIDTSAAHAVLAASPVEQPEAAPIEAPLRVLMGAVNAYEKETGIGGWYAERIQESCNSLLKAAGSPVRFGIGSENPVEEPAPSPADERAAFEAALDKRAKSAGFEVDRMTECELDNAWWGWQAARAASANETGAEVATELAERATLAAGQWANSNTPIAEALAYRDGYIAGARSPAMAAEAVDWRELCRRLYVELFHCDQQMRSTRDEDGEPHWTQSTVVRDVLADAKAALDAAPQPAQADAPASERAPHDNPFKRSIQGVSALLEDMRDDCVARLNVGNADAMVAAAFIMLVRKLVDRAFTESAAQVSYDGNHVENHCPECSQYESECECAQADARVGLTDEQRDVLTRLTTILETGRAYNGIANDNAAIYAKALRALLAAHPGTGD